MKVKKIYILDSTLREGEQSPGMALLPQEKLKITRLLESLGVDIIEVGFPSASDIDLEASILCSNVLKKSIPCVFSRLHDRDIEYAMISLKDAHKKMIHLSTSLDPTIIKKVFKTTQKEIIKRTIEYVKYLKKKHFYIEVGISNAFTANVGSIIDFCNAICEVGTDIINIADTKGLATPEKISSLISSIFSSVKKIKENLTRLSIHCHDDMGLALANTISAINAGASQVETCILGIGERAGNTPLEVLSYYLLQKKEYKIDINYKKILDVTRKISVIMGVPIKQFSPISGINVTSHSSGIHQKEIDVGIKYLYNKYKENIFTKDIIIISRHSGKAGIYRKIRELIHINPKENIIDKIVKTIKKTNKRIIGVTALLHLLKSYRLYKKEIIDTKKIKIKFNSSRYEISTYYKGEKIRTFSKNIFEGLLFCLNSLTKNVIKIKYYTTGVCGDKKGINGFAYIEAKKGKKNYSALEYSDNILIAFVNSYLDIINEVIAKEEIF